MKFLRLIGCAFLIAMVAAPASAQFTQDPYDLGAADTIDIVFSVTPDATTNKLKLQADIWIFNDSNKVIGASAGFGWINPHAQVDSAALSPEALAAYDIVRILYDANSRDTTNFYQRFVMAVARLSTPGMAANPVRRKWASYYFSLSQWNTTDSVVIDTSEWNEGAEMMFIAEGELVYKPYWTGRKLVRDTAYSVPSNLVLSTDTLYFSSVEGQGNPASQTFQVTSDADPLSFTLVEDASWILKSPSLGTTPTTITVSINNFGLTEGTYIDTISVVAPLAANSPQYLFVKLTVASPPPEIGVTPTSFFFSAVVDSANPPSQTLSVSNTGGSTLQWSIAHTEPWLDVAPASGTDDGSVTVSVDISGLAVGDYRDTLVVSDPAALNSPVRVPVWLSVASGLPEIGVAPESLFIIVDLPPDNPDTLLEAGPPPLDIPPRSLHIFNAGGGIMNYRTEEHTSRILAVTPDSGGVPQDVEITFYIPSTLEPGYYYDTLWIISDEATNSPFPVACTFYAAEHPAKIFLNRDTIVMNVYECMDGTLAPLPTTDLFIANIGGDDPMIVTFDYDDSFFEVSPPEVIPTTTVTLTPTAMHLPQGSYTTTLAVISPKAVNSPVVVPVFYNVLPPQFAPSIRTNPTAITVVTQEESGPLSDLGFKILNRYYGCFDWQLSGGAPWAQPSVTSGGVPGTVTFVIDPTGYGIGTYVDTLYINAEGADNTPRAVPMTLKIWRFRGDVNFDGKINLSDLTYLVTYVYLQGPAPQPELMVGDVNCDGVVNLSDVTFLVSYIYLHGPIPCGNPYKK